MLHNKNPAVALYYSEQLCNTTVSSHCVIVIVQDLHLIYNMKENNFGFINFFNTQTKGKILFCCLMFYWRELDLSFNQSNLLLCVHRKTCSEFFLLLLVYYKYKLYITYKMYLRWVLTLWTYLLCRNTNWLTVINI